MHLTALTLYKWYSNVTHWYFCIYLHLSTEEAITSTKLCTHNLNVCCEFLRILISKREMGNCLIGQVRVYY